MTATTGDRLVSDYLARLDTAALRLPPDRRAELVEGIAEHIAVARASGELGDEAAVRTLLDRLGAPEEIVAAAHDEAYGGGPPWSTAPAALPLAPRQPGTGLETAAVVLLTAGSVVPVVGWLAGVVLLWSSRLWRTREKLLGTLVVPGGPGILLLPLTGLALTSSEVCTTEVGPVPVPGTGASVPVPPPAFETTTCESTALLPTSVAIALSVVVLVAPVVVAVLLLRRARARAAAAPAVAAPPGRSPWDGLEIATVVVLAVGGVVSLAVPLVVPLLGLVLAWLSPQWSTTEKAVATALVLGPGALLLVVVGVGLALPAVGAGGALLTLVLLALAPPLAAGYLALALSRR